MYGIFGSRVHSGEIAGTFYVRPLFLVLWFSCVVGTLLFGGEVRLFGIYGLVEPVILVLVPTAANLKLYRGWRSCVG